MFLKSHCWPSNSTILRRDNVQNMFFAMKSLMQYSQEKFKNMV
jgi:hypothetical protein